MEIEDLLRSERILEVVPSPDGSLVAVVIRRPATARERYQQGVLTEGRADIWLVGSDGEGARNLTNGVADAAGYWLPTWSPDGEHLAMVSTKGGDNNVHAYVWGRRDGSLKRVSDAGVDLMASSDPSGANWNMHPLAWVGADELAVMFLPRGSRSWAAGGLTASTHTATAAWSKAERGAEPTVSVLETGPDVMQTLRSGALMLVNVKSGQDKMLADVPMEENSSGQRYFVLSPSNRYALVLTSERRVVDATHRLTRSQSRYRIAIVSLQASRPKVQWVDSISAVVGQQFDHMIRWSPHDTCVAILAKPTRDLDGPSHAYALSVIDGSFRPLVPDDWRTASETLGREISIELASVVWTSDGRAVVYARPPGDALGSRRPPRFDWWLLDGRGGRRNLTASMVNVPTTFSHTADPRLLVGLAGGTLWTLDIGTATATPTLANSPPLREIVWPSRRNLAVATLDRFVVDAGTGTQQKLYEITMGGESTIRHVGIAADAGVLIDYIPSRSQVISTDNTSRVAVTERGKTTDLITINRSIPRIELPAQRFIRYRGEDGDTLGAVLVLPNGYVAGKRYPLITRVYAGWIFRDTLSLDDELNDDLKLYAGHGYAVLVPSMPLKPMNVGSDPYNDIRKGVIPAVDRAIDLGIADAARLGITGGSYGGYSTYVLITSTTRFRAAVAEIGPVDLISTYGAFRATDRYGDQPHLTLANAKMAEDGQLRMGTSPWGDLWRYLKNSPLYYLDRVETPLLIVQTDQDITGMDQIEGMFTALHRLRKRAQLARYWGEWHGFDSPANIRDVWERKFAWFDRFLGKPMPSANPGR